jgi:hypothetical protein
MLPLAAVFALFALAACTATPDAGPSAAGSTIAAADAPGSSSESPKVPFGGQPCRSFSTDEMKKLGFTVSKPFEAGRDPDRLAFDNTCDFGDLLIEYTSQGNYKDQKDTLRSPRHPPPADLPDAFYDVLGNLWFAEKGYYVVIPNNVSDADKEKVARAIAAKL